MVQRDEGKGRFVVKIDGMRKPLAVKAANLKSFSTSTSTTSSCEPVRSEEDEKFERLMARCRRNPDGPN